MLLLNVYSSLFSFLVWVWLWVSIRVNNLVLLVLCVSL